jgi:prepilin-type N-terminal cleavage/methylation domain-containing protein
MKRSSGFTLVEVLLAMLIFMAGVAGIYSLLSTALGMQRAGSDTADLTRRLDELVWQLERDLGQGLHWDEAEARWKDVESAAFGDGFLYSCRFSPEIGNERAGTLVATIAMARTEAGLAGAEPVSYVLTPGLTAADAVRSIRRRKNRP